MMFVVVVVVVVAAAIAAHLYLQCVMHSNYDSNNFLGVLTEESRDINLVNAILIPFKK